MRQILTLTFLLDRLLVLEIMAYWLREFINHRFITNVRCEME